MSINYGSAYRTFRKEQGKLREQYRQLGMTDEQIKAMYEFDLKAFRVDCVYHNHTQALTMYHVLFSVFLCGSANRKPAP